MLKKHEHGSLLTTVLFHCTLLVVAFAVGEQVGKRKPNVETPCQEAPTQPRSSADDAQVWLSYGPSMWKIDGNGRWEGPSAHGDPTYVALGNGQELRAGKYVAHVPSTPKNLKATRCMGLGPLYSVDGLTRYSTDRDCSVQVEPASTPVDCSRYDIQMGECREDR